MSALVSSFERIEIQDYQYLFFIVFWNELQTTLTEQLKEHVDPVGAAVEDKAMIVRAFEKASYDTAEQVVSKNWSEEYKKHFSKAQDPFLLIINTSFKDFDPQQHPWAIIWFSGNPDQINKVFGHLIRITRKGENIFDYFQIAKTKKWYQKYAKHIEIKPNIYGISVDAKGIFEEITGLDS